MNNEVFIEAGEEMRALNDPIPPEFVREFHLSTIHYPVPEESLSTALTETLKVLAHVWRDYFEGVLLTVDDTARRDRCANSDLVGESDAFLPRE